jgi:transcriptional regulator with XRE-family HTH domain
MQIHEKIERARVSAGLTQDQMAEKLGIKRSTYQYWEKKTPGIDKLRQVAKALHLPNDYFLGNGDENFVSHNTVSSGNENHQAPSSPTALEQAILNLSESDIIKARALESSARNLEVSARNLERVIHLLEIKMGITPNLLEPADRGDLGTETLINEKDVQNSGPRTGSRTRSG